ncbi:MAG: M42 family peptidase [Anaerolineaceae bacterium]
MTTKNMAPLIEKEQIDLLERLSNACGILSDVGEIRKIVLESIKPYCDDVHIDALGNVLAIRKAQQPDALRVMVAAHMDEVGFMVVEKEEGGLFRMVAVGGIDSRYLPGKPVLAGKEHVPGVIGAKPIHLMKKDEMNNTMELEDLRLDVGPDGGDKVKPGDPVYFATKFQQVGPSLMGKALDDRLGVVSLISLIQHAPANIELLAAFTVQEEIGLRGARVAAYAFNPDLAIVMDSTPSHDLPTWDGSENIYYNTKLDAGPAIYVADTGTLSDPRLLQRLFKIASENEIPYQIRQPGKGGTDAGSIHRQRAGIPSVSISVPGRYAHSPVMISRFNDWKNTLTLVHTALAEMPKNLLQRN